MLLSNSGFGNRITRTHFADNESNEISNGSYQIDPMETLRRSINLQKIDEGQNLTFGWLIVASADVFAQPLIDERCYQGITLAE